MTEYVHPQYGELRPQIRRRKGEELWVIACQTQGEHGNGWKEVNDAAFPPKPTREEQEAVLNRLAERGVIEKVTAVEEASPEKLSARKVQELPIDCIGTGDNPRKHFDAGSLQELADSIRAHGVLEPIVVRMSSNCEREPGGIKLVIGERRLRAAQIAGLEAIPCLIIEDMDDRTALAVALVENIQREDLNPMEVAQAYQGLLDAGYRQKELAALTGQAASTISNARRLLELPESVQTMIRLGRLSGSHGKALLSYLPATAAVERLAELAVEKEWPSKHLEGITLEIAIMLGPGLCRPFPLVAPFNYQEKCPGKCQFYRVGRGTSTATAGFCFNPECFDRQCVEYQRRSNAQFQAARRRSAEPETSEEAPVAETEVSEETQRLITERLEASGKMTATLISEITRIPQTEVSAALAMMMAAGRVTIDDGGWYALVQSAAGEDSAEPECEICGCTELNACPPPEGPCWWVSAEEIPEGLTGPLCSVCLKAIRAEEAVESASESAEEFPRGNSDADDQEIKHRIYADPDHDGGLIFIHQGWLEVSHGKWGVFRRKRPGAGMHRVKSPALPMVDTWQEAQANLDAYAERKGWEVASVEDAPEIREVESAEASSADEAVERVSPDPFEEMDDPEERLRESVIARLRKIGLDDLGGLQKLAATAVCHSAESVRPSDLANAAEVMMIDLPPGWIERWTSAAECGYYLDYLRLLAELQRLEQVMLVGAAVILANCHVGEFVLEEAQSIQGGAE